MEENKPLENIVPEPSVLPETSEIIPVTPVVEQNKKPWMKIAILLIVILLIAGGLVYAGMQPWKNQTKIQNTPIVEPTPTPDPTAEWKSCTNIESGFSIKYPEMFTTGECQVFMLSKGTNPSEQALYLEGIEILAIKNPKNLSFLDWLKSPEIKLAGEILMPSEELKINETSISGVKWLSLEENEIPLGFPPSGEIYWATLSKDKVILIGVLNLNYKDYKTTIEQILSTFKFLPEVNLTPEVVEGRFCGGIAANLPENQCPTGFKCQLDGNYPDAGGKCIKN